jgi:hypothetical protein
VTTSNRIFVEADLLEPGHHVERTSAPDVCGADTDSARRSCAETIAREVADLGTSDGLEAGGRRKGRTS